MKDNTQIKVICPVCSSADKSIRASIVSTDPETHVRVELVFPDIDYFVYQPSIEGNYEFLEICTKCGLIWNYVEDLSAIDKLLKERGINNKRRLKRKSQKYHYIKWLTFILGSFFLAAWMLSYDKQFI